MDKSFLNNLEWRFATKSFDSEKQIQEDEYESLLKAIQFTPTSYGLQPFHVHVISDSDLRKQLREVAFNQPQITEAQYLFVFSARDDFDSITDLYIKESSDGDEAKAAKMKGFKDMVMSSVGKLEEDAAFAWASRQAYIALGFAMAACAELKIDSCPMEGFQPEEFDKLLKLPKTMRSVVLLTVGHRKDEPSRTKFRFEQSDLFTMV